MTGLKKKIHDLELTRMISIQTAPQIRLVQNSDTMMVEKIQTTVVNTIPLWKSQMVLALGVEHASQAAQAQRQVTDMTNDLLRKNAEVLKVASVEAAKESERGNRRSGNTAEYQRISDLYPGRSDADPGRRQNETTGSRSGTPEDGR